MRTRTVSDHASRAGLLERGSGCRVGNRWCSRSTIANDADVPRDREDARSRAQTLYAPLGLVRQDRGLAPVSCVNPQRLTRGFGAAHATASPDWGVGCQNGRADRTEWNGMIAVEISAGYVNRPCVLVPDSSPATNLYQLIRRTPPECFLGLRPRRLTLLVPPQKRHMFSKLNTCRGGINYKNRKNNFFFTDRFACIRTWSDSTLGPRAVPTRGDFH